MSRFCARWPLIVACACAVSTGACTLLTSADDLRVGGDPSPSPIPATPTPNPDGAAVDVGDGSIPHITAPFDAAGFPTFDASVNDAAEGGTSNVFFDDFNRADGDPLGNGWVERQPTAFKLLGGVVIKTDAVTTYRDNIVYRPISEDLLDAEITLEMRVTGIPADGSPQLWIRAQKIGQNVVDGYHVYLDDSRLHFHLARHVGTQSTEIAAMDAPANLDAAKTYRWLLRATGTSPVAVYTRLDVRNQNNAWQMLCETGDLDNGSDRIKTAGSVGFSGASDSKFTYDNFMRVAP